MQLEMPKSALTFSENLHIDFSDGGGAKKAKMLGYSGKPMQHWLFGQLVVDVQGINFVQPKIPILEDHDDGKKIGYSKKPDTSNNQVYFPDITLLDNETANQFYNNAKQGFPYQASISFYPKKIEEVLEGSKAEVNGFTVKGPALIFRETNFRESSAVTFGMDHRTSTEALSDEEKISVDLSNSDAEIIQKYLKEKPHQSEETPQPSEETPQKHEKEQSMEEKVQELEQKVQSYEAALEDNKKTVQSYEQKLNEYEQKVAQLEKETTQKELAAKLSKEQVDFIMKFYDKLEKAELMEMADQIASYEKKINELGAPVGSDETPSPKTEPSFEDVEKYAKDNGVSVMEANRILTEQIQ